MIDWVFNNYVSITTQIKFFPEQGTKKIDNFWENATEHIKYPSTDKVYYGGLDSPGVMQGIHSRLHTPYH